MDTCPAETDCWFPITFNSGDSIIGLEMAKWSLSNTKLFRVILSKGDEEVYACI